MSFRFNLYKFLKSDPVNFELITTELLEKLRTAKERNGRLESEHKHLMTWTKCMIALISWKHLCSQFQTNGKNFKYNAPVGNFRGRRTIFSDEVPTPID